MPVLEILQGQRDFEDRALIGVAPDAELARRGRLFAALEQAFHVRFAPQGGRPWHELDGLVAIGQDGAAVAVQAPGTLPCLVAEAQESQQRQAEVVALADDPGLPRPLRGARLRDARAVPLGSVSDGLDETICATLDGRPVWTIGSARSTRHRVGVIPDELGADEALRDRLTPERCVALIAMTQFLREAAPWSDTPGPLKAAFLLDDPNLHWPTYGHLRYRQILNHAAVHNYHLSVAMVPLDGWLAHPRAVELFRRGSARLSITVHGNDHDGAELRGVKTPADGMRLARHALARAAKFERRTGLPMDRVMVPPHEAASEAAAVALRRAGFEAMCMTRPYPWLSDGLPWLTRPREHGPLAGWGYTDIVAGGLPVLLRTPFDGPPEELVLRAFLGQPLIVYGHHDVLADGPDKFAETAATINALGPVSWGSLASIARAGAETWRAGGVLHIRPLSRLVHVEVPPETTHVRVDMSAVSRDPHDRLCVRATSPHRTGAIDVAQDGVVRVPPCSGLELGIEGPPERAEAQRTRDGSRRLARRLASEARDRGSVVAAVRVRRRPR